MKSFFKLFLKNEPDAHKIALLYGAIMAQSRSPAFFLRYGLSDDFETRFESLILHMLLVMRRLSNDKGSEALDVKQALMDFMVSDLDRTLREMGVGDVGVVKRMKTFMEGFYGRMNAYDAALSNPDKKEILRALDRNLYGATSTDLAKLEMMREYIEVQTAALAAQLTSDILSGQISFRSIGV